MWLDPDFKEAARKWVLAEQFITTSKLQRQFACAYNVAARVIEALERDGVISIPSKDGFRVTLLNQHGEAEDWRTQVEIVSLPELEEWDDLTQVTRHNLTTDDEPDQQEETARRHIPPEGTVINKMMKARGII